MRIWLVTVPHEVQSWLVLSGDIRHFKIQDHLVNRTIDLFWFEGDLSSFPYQHLLNDLSICCYGQCVNSNDKIHWIELLEVSFHFPVKFHTSVFCFNSYPKLENTESMDKRTI